jgi:hypothetical protein
MKPNSTFRFFALLAVIPIVGLACLGGTPTPTDEPVVIPPVVIDTPVQEPSPEPPPPTEAPIQPAAQDFFTEEFDGDISNWSQVVSSNGADGDTSQANVSVEDGKLIFDLGKWLIAYVFYDPYIYTDVRLDITVENRGTNINNVLLVCRASEEGHYLVNIANSGLFAIYAFDGVKGTYNRIADGGSNKIKAGKEFNDYGLVCIDKTLTIYINGSEVRKYTDNQYVLREGQVGVGVASENQVPVKLEFENVTISQP